MTAEVNDFYGLLFIVESNSASYFNSSSDKETDTSTPYSNWEPALADPYFKLLLRLSALNEGGFDLLSMNR
jgi:hypothetical protein